MRTTFSGNNPFMRHGGIGEAKIKMDRNETGWEGVRRTNLV
jgi:hypothetical protein